MSKLLDLATKLEENSKKEIESSKEALRIVLQEHEAFIKSSLHTSQENIISDMASQQELMQQQNTSLMQTYQTILTQHSQQLANMEQALIQQNTAFKERVKQSEKNLYRLAARPLLWLITGGSLVAMLAAALIGLWMATEKHQKIKDSIEERQQVLKKLQDDTYGIQITDCPLNSGGTVPCVAVEPKAPAWGQNQEYRMILPKKD